MKRAQDIRQVFPVPKQRQARDSVNPSYWRLARKRLEDSPVQAAIRKFHGASLDSGRRR